jgi:AcrR family transcriptional regulator
MRKKGPHKRPRRKQKRLSSDDRRKEFVTKATEFFSEEGFGGGTRDLARRLGVTQPLLYRYFPSKDDLIKEVYRTVYLEPLDAGWDWDALLMDRTRPLRDRLREFYCGYTDVIFTRKWLRIYLYSGLKGLDINRWYVGVVRDEILTRIVGECRHQAGLEGKPTAPELEMAWVFHSGIFYYGVRKYIYDAPVLEDKEQMICNAVDAFLAGYERVFGRTRVGIVRPAVKVVG